MIFNIYEIFAAGLCYLTLLFLIAYVTDKGLIPDKIIRHPLVFVLSLGIFASAWAYYGIIGLAHSYGLGYLFYYFGASSFFMLSPLLLNPLLTICRNNQLKSLSDLLSFRFRTPWAGSLVTLFLLCGLLPFLALQIQAVTDTIHIMTGDNLGFIEEDDSRYDALALVFCLCITLFAILFGTQQSESRDRNNGLVAAIAAETVIKVAALIILGCYALFSVFDGPDNLQTWLQHNPTVFDNLYSSFSQYSTRTLLLTSFAAAIGMPYMFHMIFAERPSDDAIKVSTWGVPLLLLVISLPVLPILWAGYASGTEVPADYFSIGIGMINNNYWLTLIAYIGGLSAASGVVLVSTLALASMCLNHLILPYYLPPSKYDIYQWLKWVNRLLIAAIIFGGYTFFRTHTSNVQLGYLGIAAFAATLQFLPAIFAVVYSPFANKKGFICGLIVGFFVWFWTLIAPIISATQPWYSLLMAADLVGEKNWIMATTGSLAANILVFFLVSFFTRRDEKEIAAAQSCAINTINHRKRQQLAFTSINEFKTRLSSVLGSKVAEREIGKAMAELKLIDSDNRPYSLRRLRERLEGNLSSLLGTSLALDIIDRQLPYKQTGTAVADEDVQLIENTLETYKKNLTGVAAELDGLRRLHRQTLLDLPIAVCSLGPDYEILLWNHSMTSLTGIAAEDILGSNVRTLTGPWREVLIRFAESEQQHQHKQHITIDEADQYFSLHKASRRGSTLRYRDQLIVLEDLNEVHLLEKELIHTERLASIGRLAAGVAHEIGNPVTGIACLAQNLRYESNAEDIHQTADDIVKQTERISSIVHSLVSFSHNGKHHSSNTLFKPVNVFMVVEEACKLITLDTHYDGVEIVNLCDEDHFIDGDEQTLVQVFINLLSNARDASPEEGLIMIETLQQCNNIIVTVTDQGEGITADKQQNIFEPFFTTKEPGKGTGLGLALVYSIIEDHGGSISVTSPVDVSNNRGTQFVITLASASL